MCATTIFADTTVGNVSCGEK